MNTTIRMHNLQLPVSLGVYDWEHTQQQKIILHIDIQLVTEVAARAAQSDELADTLDYATLESSLIALLQSKHFQLLEHLCAVVATHILSHPFAQHVRVEIVKPGALQNAPAVAMILETGK